MHTKSSGARYNDMSTEQDVASPAAAVLERKQIFTPDFTDPVLVCPLLLLLLRFTPLQHHLENTLEDDHCSLGLESRARLIIQDRDSGLHPSRNVDV